MTELYRTTSLGTALTDALDVMIQENRISAALGNKVLRHFDRAFVNCLAEEQELISMAIKGTILSYNFVDGVWTFTMKDVHMEDKKGAKNVILGSRDIDRLRIITLDARVVQKAMDDS